MVAIGEPLPLENNKDRLHRCGLLNEELLKENNSVIWWSSTFNHLSKKHYYNEKKSIKLSNSYRLELMHGCRYKKNISFSRIRNHYQLGEDFKNSIKKHKTPDLIFCAFPSIELAYFATKFAKLNKVPIIIDARDLWPDIFLSILPKPFRFTAKIFLFHYFKMTRYIFKNATKITGVTNGIVNWGLDYAKRPKKDDKSFYLAYPNQDFKINKSDNEFISWQEWGMKNNNFVISYIGSITKNKLSLDIIIKAAKRLNNLSNIKFVIAGDGDDREYYLNKSKGLNNIIFPGWINKRQIKSLLSISELGLVPIKNRFDFMMSIPNKPIEYMAHGVPLLSSLKGELESLIEKEKIGFHYNNELEFVEVVNNSYNNQEQLKMKKNNCQKLFDKSFSSKIVYSQLSSYIQSSVK